MEPLDIIINFLNNFITRASIFIPEWFLAFIKSISALISALLFIGIIIIILKTNLLAQKVEKFNDFLGMPAVSKRKGIKAWQQILRRLQKGDEAQNKIAIIEADKIFSEILKQMGYRGETVAEQLKLITIAQLSNIEEIWQAHKIRNKIVHEPSFQLSNYEAQAIIDIYHQAFKELNLID